MRNTNNIRLLLAVAIILAGLALTLTVLFKTNRKKEVSPKPAVHFPAADVSLQKVHYIETRKGKKVWDLFADKAEYDRKSNTTRLSNIKLVLAGDETTGNVELVAGKAIYVNGSGDVTLTGNVRAHSTSGMQFSTSMISYEAARSTVSTSAPVSFSNGMLNVQGIGMELSTDRRYVKVGHSVEATILPGKSGQ